MANVETTVTPPRTIIVQTNKPPLIPDENSSWCFTRRNFFDAIIALAIAGVIIYFVMAQRKNNMNAAADYGMGTQSGFQEMGQRVGGAIRKLFS
jgi:protein associated with RNAse G/E